MLGYDLRGELPTIRSEHVTIVPGDTVVLGDKVEVKSARRDLCIWELLVMAVRLAWKLPQMLILPTEVFTKRVYVGVESQDVKAVLAQLSETPCVTVQVKVTTSPGHAAVLPSCSTLDTNMTSATGMKCTTSSLDNQPTFSQNNSVRHSTRNTSHLQHSPIVATG